MPRKPSEFDRIIGAKVREQRRIKGLSQKDLADGLGLSFQQIQKYETGKNRISSEMLQQISHILDISVLSFFPKEEEEPKVIDSNIIHVLRYLQNIRDPHLIEPLKMLLRELAEKECRKKD